MTDALRITAIVRQARDPAALAAFYRAAFDAVADGERAVRLGKERIAFVAAAQAEPASAPSNSVSFQHAAIIVSDMERAMERLRAVADWRAISRDGPEQLPEASGGVVAFKFRDPEGHPLEFLCFPDGRAPDPWRERPGLFQGIDHSAVSVRDTDESLRFYRTLGFTVLSRNTNRGAEQARMDGLADVDPSTVAVEVTGLQPPGGAPPHLELLCYRTPSVLAAVPGLGTALRLSGGDALPAQDPDGHALLTD